MYYLLAILADVGITGTFSIGKLYRDRMPWTVRSVAGKMAFTSFLSFWLFFTLNGFTLVLNGFTLLMAVVMAAIGILSEAVCFTAYGKGQISLFTIFQMQGGMLLPFLYGALRGDRLTAPRIAGILFMTIALTLTAAPERKGSSKLSRGFITLCCAIFLINGSVSIGSYIYSNHPHTLGPNSFLICRAAILCTVSTIGWCVAKFRGGIAALKSSGLLPCAGLLFCSTALDNGSYFLQLVSAAHLSSTVLYPVVTGGTIVLTAIAGRMFFQEKQSKRALLGTALSFLATLLFAF